MRDIPKSGLSRTTPFPNELIDDVMPRLNDTQWRVLCVIVRQTLGWYDRQTGTRKMRDWLTQSQLKARTGRNAEALAAAVDVLVRQDYIVVEDEAGNPLNSSQKRRAYRGRCYYCLADAWLQRVGVPIAKMSGKDLAQPAHAGFHSQVPKTEFESIGKSNRTKENQTKEKALTATPSSVHAPVSKPSAQAQAFIALFGRISQEYWSQPADVTLSPGELARLNRLLGTHEGIDWTPHFRIFFRSDFQYVKRNRYALSAFLNTANVLLLMKPPSVATVNPSPASPRNV